MFIKDGSKMWYIIFGWLLISALFAVLFWFALIAAKRSDEKNRLDLSDADPKDSGGLEISDKQAKKPSRSLRLTHYPKDK